MDAVKVHSSEMISLKSVPVSTGLSEIDKKFTDAEKFIAQKLPEGIKRVLLVVPPDAAADMFSFETGKKGRYWNYPPYGLGLLANFVRKDDIEVEILNLNHLVLAAVLECDTEDQFDFNAIVSKAVKTKLAEFEPQFVGITCLFSQTHQSTIDTANLIKSVKPSVALGLGGVHVSNSFMGGDTREALLQDYHMADFLFLFESELSFREFVRVSNKLEKTDRLAQVAFLTEEGVLHFSAENKPVNEDLDPQPAYDAMQMDELPNVGKIGTFYSQLDPGIKSATCLSNRGCRAQCSFCSVRNFNGVGVRGRSVKAVVDEIEHLRDHHDIRHIMWLDDDLLYNRKRAIELFNEMTRRNLGVTWDCTNGVIAASCKEEVIHAAAESGCIGMILGMESGNSKILRDIKKPGTPEVFLTAASVLRKYEQINTRVFVMIGFPGETYRMIQDTIQVAAEMDMDWTNVFILQPLPNTPIFDQMMADGQIGNVNFSDIRFVSGAYGKLKKNKEQSRDMLARDFKSAFQGMDMDSIPPAEALDDIWAYMNYHLNFARLLKEERPTKLKIQYKWLSNIANLIAPDNAFAQYFQAYLHGKINHSHIPEDMITRVEDTLNRLPYWQSRFDDFDIRVSSLRNKS